MWSLYKKKLFFEATAQKNPLYIIFDFFGGMGGGALLITYYPLMDLHLRDARFHKSIINQNQTDIFHV